MRQVKVNAKAGHSAELHLRFKVLSQKADRAAVFGLLAKGLVVLCCLAASGTVRSWGQTIQDAERGDFLLRKLSLEELGNIEVTTVSKDAEQVWKTPAAIHVVTQEDIRRSGATTIPEVLRLVPGVQVSRIDSNHWAIGIRGFANGFSKSVLVLIDGRSVYTPLFAGVFWGLQDTRLEDIERIEVIRGPGGTIWGANAVNGVINIITRNSRQSHGSAASVLSGNVEQGVGSFRYGGGDGTSFDYRIYGKVFSRGGQFHPQGDNFDTWRMGQVGFRTDLSIGQRDTLTLQGDSYKGGQGQRVGIGSFSPPAQLIADGATEVFGGNLLARWHREWSATSDTQVQTYYDRTDLLAPHFGEIRSTVDLDVVHHLTRKRHSLVGGLGARWSPATFIQTVPTLNFDPHRQTNSIYSAFLQDEAAIVHNRLFLTVGSKLEHNNYSGLQLQPSVRLLWRHSSQSTVWFAVTRALRAPSRIERDMQLIGFLAPAPPLPIYVQVDGNRNIAPERLLGYEAGYRALVARNVFLDISAFHNEYDALVNFGPPAVSIDVEPPPARIALHVPWANGIVGATDGIEVAPAWNLNERWQFKGSYSYLHFALKNKRGNVDVGTVATYEGSSPQHQLMIRSIINLPKGFEFDQTYRYVSALPAQAVSSYNTADVRLGWRLAAGWEFSLVGQNLLQPHHSEFRHDPGPTTGMKRSAYIRIGWSGGR